MAHPAKEPNDTTTTVAELREVVRKFVDQRNWRQFHAPKNISMAMAIEAAELMEHFQWMNVEESRQVATQKNELAAVGEELADVLCYALAMANELDIDLATALLAKMQKNEQKYPAERFHGRYR